jgi:CRISPR-associated endonuclease Csn1
MPPRAPGRAAAGAGTGSAAAGVLHESPQKLNELASRPLAALTNNHLVRHRLTILEKLLGKLVAKYAAGDASKVGRVVVEVIRDLQEFSGLNDKQKAQLLGQKLGHHRRIAEELKIALEKMGVPREMSAGLIRKARIFDDQGRKCPYTGAELSLQDLLTPGLLDLDHIIPRSIRPSDSLDSLVLTFSEINKLKTNKTAWQFVQDCAAVTGGVTVNVGGEKGNKQIFTPEQFKAFVEKMPWRVRGGSDDDERRLRRRKQLLLTTEYKEREGGFLPKDLTQTSHLVKLAASRIKAFFKNQKVAPVVVHLPGSATGAVRKSWHPMGCLGAVIPAVKDADGKVKSKTDIRNITHLHHAVDAATLGWIATFLNRNQGNQLWEAMLKRNATAADAAILRDNGNFSLNNEGKWDLRDIPQELKDELIEKLGEFHVSVHIPATRKGLRVEETVWGVRDKDPADPKVTLVQRGHSDSVLKKVSLATGGETEVPMATLASKTDSVKPAKLLGYERAAGADGVLVGRPIGKLGAQKGVRVIAENYGVALDPTPTVIPYFKVHSKLRELAAANGGKWPRVLRNGMVISVGAGTYKGRWRIKSVKDNADGLALDLCAPDALNTQRTNVRLATLLRPESRLVIERGAL